MSECNKSEFIKDKRMIRIAMEPIKISVKGENRWGQPIKHWSVPRFGYVEKDRYEALLNYEDPLEGFLDGSSEFNRGDLEGLKNIITELKLKPLNATGLVYEFNARTNRKIRIRNSYIRLAAIFNNKNPVNRIQKISWFDAYVKYPIYSFICAVANTLHI